MSLSTITIPDGEARTFNDVKKAVFSLGPSTGTAELTVNGGVHRLDGTAPFASNQVEFSCPDGSPFDISVSVSVTSGAASVILSLYQ